MVHCGVIAHNWLIRLADRASFLCLFNSMLHTCNHVLPGSSAALLSQRRVVAVPRRSGTLVARSGSTDQGKTRPPSEVPAAKEHGAKRVKDESKVRDFTKKKEKNGGLLWCSSDSNMCTRISTSEAWEVSVVLFVQAVDDAPNEVSHPQGGEGTGTGKAPGSKQ